MNAEDDEAASDARHEARRWLSIVEDDLAVAHAAANLSPSRLGAAAYHPQQAAEKLVKALLVLRATPFRRTHDLDELISSVDVDDARALPDLDELRPLSTWNIAFRYPTLEDAEEPPSLAEIERVGALIRKLSDQAAKLVAAVP